MRFVQAATLPAGTVIYLGLFVFGWFRESFDLFVASIICFNVLILLVTILVVIDSVRKVRAGKARELAAGVFVTKLAAIPYFVINFAMLALIALGGAALFIHGIGIALLAVVGIGTVLTYLAMISTSVYGWASVVLLRRERRIGGVQVVLYTIFLAVFVTDILVGILLFIHSRRGRVSAVVGEADPAPATAVLTGS